MTSLRFDQPALLLLALAAVPLLVIGWRALPAFDRMRRVATLGLRAGLLVVLAVVLAGPYRVREHDQLTVIGLLDVSGSVRRFADLPPVEDLAGGSNLEYLRRWFLEATGTRAPDDRFGLVVFDGQAIAFSVPSRRGAGTDSLDLFMREGTNIAEAVRLGLALFPPDTARRIVLVSDGNETMGNALEAARQAAGGRSGSGDAAAVGRGTTVPIDVLPITYQIRRDVQIVRAEAPTTAQPAQVVTVRVILEATRETPGRLTLRREGRPVDLNGAARGYSRRVTVPAGRSVQLARVDLDDTPVNRFEAIFEPDDPDHDALPENNRAEAFTATPSRGQVLLVETGAGAGTGAGTGESGGRGYLATVLEQAGIPFAVREPGLVPGDLLGLQRYDLIVLDNVPAFELSPPQQALLARYVHDLGGGLIMTGGEQAFGAGGWNGSPLEAVLPLEMDPPREIILPTAALVLVLDKSGSMNRNVAGARATQQTVANEAAALAIESLRADSMIGVISFDSGAYERVPLQRNTDPQGVADRVRGIIAGGGTNLRPALERARRMLANVEVDRKRVVCLSDGESPDEGLDDLVRAMAAEGIALTTIAVGDEADYETLARLASLGNGEFYPVRNPKQLPRVLVDSVQVVNRPLIKEKPFVPRVLATGSSLTGGLDRAPPLGGLVITAPRDDPTVLMEMVHPDGEPLLAHWQAGLGRVAAFTSDAGGAWSSGWQSWAPADAFWTQLVRVISRPAVSLDTELIAVVEDDRLDITFEASGGEQGFMNYLVVDGTVYSPGGEPIAVRLRQTAPGRYQGAVPAVEAGNYIVALSPRHGTRRLAPAIGGANKPSSPEFRRYESNTALLERLMEMTSGRRLDLASPRGVDLFDRAGMPRSISSLPSWRSFLWLALAVLLLDIACRRIAWDGRQVRRALARAVGRVVPASVKGGEAEATLASLRRASGQGADETGAAASGGGAEPATGPQSSTDDVQTAWASPVAGSSRDEPEARPARRRPDAKRVAAALDAFLGRRRAKGEDDPDQPGEAEEEDRSSPEETTSSLLAAKRRARQERG